MYLNKYHAFTDPTLAVCFYQSGGGAEPVRDWLSELPKAARKAIGEDMKTVQFGWPLIGAQSWVPEFLGASSGGVGRPKLA